MVAGFNNNKRGINTSPPIYNKMNKLLYKVYDKFPKGSQYLDLGCGQGNELKFMKSRNFNVEGVDKLYGQDLKTYEIKKDFYDVVSCFYVLHFFKKHEVLDVIEKIKAGMKAGGYFVFDDFNGLTKKELKQLFKGWKFCYLKYRVFFELGHKNKPYPHFHKSLGMIVIK